MSDVTPTRQIPQRRVFKWYTAVYACIMAVIELAFLALLVAVAIATAWFIVIASELQLTLPFGVSLVVVR